VRYLVEHGADKDKACTDGITPMVVAMAGGHFEVVRYLIAAGAA
jgi:ankyrin repeat protein